MGMLQKKSSRFVTGYQVSVDEMKSVQRKAAASREFIDLWAGE